MDRCNEQTGFTLLELIVTMAISGVLMAIAIPSFKYVTTTNRISGEVNALLGDMQFARMEAIKEGAPVTICASTDGSTCSNSQTWSTGWIVLQNDGVTVLRLSSSYTNNHSSDTLTTNNVPTVIFNREGFAPTLLSASGVGTAIFSVQTAASATFTRCLIVASTGLLTSATPGTLGC